MNRHRVLDACPPPLLVPAFLGTALLTSCMTPPSPSTGITTETTAEIEGPRFSFVCTTVDGRVMQPLTSLEEVWAAPGYTEISSCAVAPLVTDPVLTADERTAVAHVADDVPGEVEALQMLLENCTRLAPGHGAEALSTRILEAALLICPDAPHANLMRDELETREGGDGVWTPDPG